MRKEMDVSWYFTGPPLESPGLMGVSGLPAGQARHTWLNSEVINSFLGTVTLDICLHSAHSKNIFECPRTLSSPIFQFLNSVLTLIHSERADGVDTPGKSYRESQIQKDIFGLRNKNPSRKQEKGTFTELPAMHKEYIFSFNPPTNATRYFHLGDAENEADRDSGKGCEVAWPGGSRAGIQNRLSRFQTKRLGFSRV